MRPYYHPSLIEYRVHYVGVYDDLLSAQCVLPAIAFVGPVPWLRITTWKLGIKHQVQMFGLLRSVMSQCFRVVGPKNWSWSSRLLSASLCCKLGCGSAEFGTLTAYQLMLAESPYFSSSSGPVSVDVVFVERRDILMGNSPFEHFQNRERDIFAWPFQSFWSNERLVYGVFERNRRHSGFHTVVLV